jgi:hypothetical protein
VTGVPADAEPHIRAVQAALAAPLGALPTPIKAYIGTRPDVDRNCVVIHGSTGDLSGTLGDRYADIVVPVQLTAVGEGPEQASAYADSARRALLAAALVVTGRRVWPARQAASQPVLRDDTVQPPLWIATAQYEITSNPA